MSIPGGVPEQGVLSWEHSWTGKGVILEFTREPIFISRYEEPDVVVEAEHDRPDVSRTV